MVSHAQGVLIWDADGRELIDFAGGIGCQNLGHGHPAILEAVHAQVDSYLPPVLHGRNLRALRGGLPAARRALPCRGEEQKSLLLNSGAEGIENAVKIARKATGRPAVIVFERGFHGRTLLTMTMSEKLVYKAGFGPFAPEVYRVPAPYPFRGITSDDAIAALERLFKAEVDPVSVACAVLEPVQGEGGFIPMPADFLRRLRELLDRHGILYVDDEVQSGAGRTGRLWAIEHYEVSSPTCSSPASRSAAGFRSRRSPAGPS